MKFSLLVCLALLVDCAVVGPACAENSNVTVTVTGRGLSLDEAKTDAIRQALQQTISQLVVVDRVVSNNNLLRDKVMSTMNGYIERYTERNMRRVDGGFVVDTEITVSASRINNFVGVTTGGSGLLEGSSLQDEQSRRLAQQQANKLQVRARGEIFDRVLRGFPSADVNVHLVGYGLSDNDPNLLVVKLKIEYKDEFVRAMEGTLATLAFGSCEFPREGFGDVRNAWRFRDGCIRRHKLPAQRLTGKDPDFLCLTRPTAIRCYLLERGDYCASCLLKKFDDSINGMTYVIFGRFIDAFGRSAMAGNAQNCVTKFGILEERGKLGEYVAIQTNIIAAATPGYGGPLLGALDLDTRHVTIQIGTSSVKLEKANYFVAIPALVRRGGYIFGESSAISGQLWLTDLVPSSDHQRQDGCILLDEAIERQLLTRIGGK